MSRASRGCCSHRLTPGVDSQQRNLLVSSVLQGLCTSAGCTTAGLSLLCWAGSCVEEGRRKCAPCPAGELRVMAERRPKGDPAWQKPEMGGNGTKGPRECKPFQPVASPAAQKLCHCRVWFPGVDGEALTRRATLYRCTQTFSLPKGFHPAAVTERNRNRQLFELGSVLTACADLCGFLHVYVLFLPYVLMYVGHTVCPCWVSLLPRAVHVDLQPPAAPALLFIQLLPLD